MAEDNSNDYISPVSGQAFEQAFHTRDDLSLEEQIELAKEQFAKLQAERDELLERDTEEAGFKIGMFDIETTGFDADFGIMLCACMKTAGVKKVQTLRIDQFPDYRERMWDDSNLVRAVKEMVEKHDIIVTWNGKRFDMPFLTTRLIDCGADSLEQVMHLDLLYTARFKLKLGSNALDNVLSFLEHKSQKTSVDPRVWRMAQFGDTESMNYIVEHCELDVLELEKVFNKFKPYITKIFKG